MAELRQEWHDRAEVKAREAMQHQWHVQGESLASRARRRRSWHAGCLRVALFADEAHGAPASPGSAVASRAPNANPPAIATAAARPARDAHSPSIAEAKGSGRAGCASVAALVVPGNTDGEDGLLVAGAPASSCRAGIVEDSAATASTAGGPERGSDLDSSIDAAAEASWPVAVLAAAPEVRPVAVPKAGPDIQPVAMPALMPESGPDVAQVAVPWPESPRLLAPQELPMPSCRTSLPRCARPPQSGTWAGSIGLQGLLKEMITVSCCNGRVGR